MSMSVLGFSAHPAIALSLSFLLTVQTAAPSGTQDPSAPKLKIVILEGEGATNNIKKRVAREPVVQVTDENNKPIGGAVVVFLLPSVGAGGTFRDGNRMLTVMTDQNGKAVARGLRPNSLSGKFEIRVTASHQGQTATASISQVNTLTGAAAGSAGGAAAGGASVGAGAGLSATTIGLIVGAVAGGAIGAGVALKSRGGGDKPRVPAATIGGPGGPVFGPPR